MGLLDLKTNLLDLKFPSGINNKPLVYKDIKKKVERGGLAGEDELNNSAVEVQGILASKRLDDVIRMAKLVIAKPGLSYIIKSALNGFIDSVDTKALYTTDATLGQELIGKAKDILLTQVTNIGQTPLNGLGLHLYKGNLEFGGRDKRDYVKRVHGELPKYMINVAHSNTQSEGIKKSKKMQLASDKKYGRIDYTKGTGVARERDFINGEDKIIRLDKTAAETENPKHGEDIIPFAFWIYDQSRDIGEPMFFRFRAYLDSMSDQFIGNWNKTNYLGRPESFVNYQGHERQVSISFKVAAMTRDDLHPIYRKLNLLASTTAPSFDKTGLFMKGSWIKITVGDYLHKTPAVVNTVQINWLVDYPWEIRKVEDEKAANQDAKVESKIQILPHVLDVSLSLDVFNNFVPQTGLFPYIGNPTDTDFINWNAEDGNPEQVRSTQKIVPVVSKPVKLAPIPQISAPKLPF